MMSHNRRFLYSGMGWRRRLAQLPERPTDKIRRDAFLYLDPKPPEDQFAQCGTCRMFTGETCTILGPDVPITAKMSCNLYVPGNPVPRQKGQELRLLTPEEAGLVDQVVRCENCKYLSDDVCGLYRLLNRTLPEVFNLDELVSPSGCCNAQTPRETSQRNKL